MLTLFLTLGSTEWVEDYVAWLGKTAVAYINVDVGTGGTRFGVSAAPLLNGVVIDSTKIILSTNSGISTLLPWARAAISQPSRTLREFLRSVWVLAQAQTTQSITIIPIMIRSIG